MSTLAYARLTTSREAAPKSASISKSAGLGTYVDAFAALVPAEVLTLHAGIIAITTKTEGQTTTILPEGLSTLQVSFWVLIVMSMALYAGVRLWKHKWDSLDWFRMFIPPLAFVGWTMLQTMTAFDAVYSGMHQIPRIVTALFLGIGLGFASAAMAYELDKKDPPAAQ